MSLPCHAACQELTAVTLSLASWPMDDVSSTSEIKASPGRQASPNWRPERCDRVALVLQGGGALGAYQAGVYQAMHEAGLEPDWVSGVSVGAINSARIAACVSCERSGR